VRSSMLLHPLKMCDIVCSYMYIAACNNSFKLLDMTSDLASKEESSNVDTSQVTWLKSHTSSMAPSCLQM
jgi:hypothetical protein